MIDPPVTDDPSDFPTRNPLTGAEHPAAAESGDGATVEASPQRIGHYAIARKLGEGGMGVVYAARDERLERSVALKTMSSLANDETARQRFWREARAAASVNHPNVCQIYEIGEDDGELFIAMELLEGEVARRAAAARTAERRGGGADRPRHARRAVGAARPRHRPSRPEAVERLPDAARREAARLRPRAARARSGALDDGRRADARRDRRGHAALHGARAGDGRGGRRAQRSVRGRRHPLRDARGPPGVRRPDGRRGAARDAATSSRRRSPALPPSRRWTA